MAKAYYNKLANSTDASSAGLLGYAHDSLEHPDEKAIKVMKEDGIDISKEKVKEVTPEMVKKSDKIIVLSSKRHCPHYILNADNVEFWQVEDPMGKSIRKYRKSRDMIKQMVLEEIKNGSA